MNITELERAIHEVADGGAGGGSRQNYAPVQEWMVAFASQLKEQHHDEDAQQNKAANLVADFQSHRQQIARRFTERGGRDLHYPECQCDLWKFTNHRVVTTH